MIPNIERSSSAIKSKEEYKNKRPLTDSEGEFDEDKYSDLRLSPTAPDFNVNYMKKTCATSKSKTTPFGFMEDHRSSDTDEEESEKMQTEDETDTHFLGFGSGLRKEKQDSESEEGNLQGWAGSKK